MQLMLRRRSFRPRLARTRDSRTRKLVKSTAKGIETKLTSSGSKKAPPFFLQRRHGERRGADSGAKGAQGGGQQMSDHLMADDIQMTGPRTRVCEPTRQRPTICQRPKGDQRVHDLPSREAVDGRPDDGEQPLVLGVVGDHGARVDPRHEGQEDQDHRHVRIGVVEQLELPRYGGPLDGLSGSGIALRAWGGGRVGSSLADPEKSELTIVHEGGRVLDAGSQGRRTYL